MRGPEAENAEIAGAGDVYEIRFEGGELTGDAALVTVQERVAAEVAVQGEREETPFQLECGDRAALEDAGAGAGMDAEEGELARGGKRGEFAAQGGNAVRLLKRIREEGNAQGRVQGSATHWDAGRSMKHAVPDK